MGGEGRGGILQYQSPLLRLCEAAQGGMLPKRLSKDTQAVGGREEGRGRATKHRMQVTLVNKYDYKVSTRS